MSYSFRDTEEQAAFRKMCRDFAFKEVFPRAALADEEERFPFDLFDKMAEHGYLGMIAPEEYGGQGASFLELAIACEEIAYYDAASSLILVNQSQIPTGVFMNFCTEEQRRDYFIPLCKGTADGKREIAAFALTEPDAGSDARGIRTRAVLDGDHYVINGSKRFISNGVIATTIFLFALTDNGLSAFIVKDTFPGFIKGKVEKKMGFHASLTSELYFEDMIVPKENLVGKEGEGFKIALSILDEDRALNAITCCAMAQRAIDESTKYSMQRVQFGKRISEFQNTKFQLAKMQTRTDAGRLLAYRAVSALMEKDPEASKYTSMAKYYCGDLVNDVSRRAVQIHGGYGYSREYPVEKIMRDAKIFEIMTGTTEIMKLNIAREMGVK